MGNSATTMAPADRATSAVARKLLLFGGMSISDRLKSEGMKLAMNPKVAKLMQDERFMRLVMTAMSMPGRVTTYTTEQKEAFAKAMGLATAEEVRDLKRIVASLEEKIARLERR